MKINFNEELNRMKYLFEVERGKVISESQIKKTYLNEETTVTFTMDFSDNSNLMFKVVTKNITYKQQKFNILWSKVSERAVGSQQGTKHIPSSESTEIKRPKIEIPIIADDSFEPNFVTPSEHVSHVMEESAESIVSAIEQLEMLDPKNILSNVEKLFGNGFIVEGHADGSPPIETKLNRTDHGSLGLYGGKKTTYEKNTWLATTRAKKAYLIFENKLNKLMYQNFDDLKLIDLVLKKFTLTPDKLKIVNHLNKDGSAKPSEIGEEFRRMIFIPTFEIELELPTTTSIAARDEKYIIPGTKLGIQTLPLFKDGSDGVKGIKIKDPGIDSGVWMGVPKDSVDELNKIGKTTFNGKPFVLGEITDDKLKIGGRNAGYIYELTSSTKGIDVLNEKYITKGMLCVDESSGTEEIDGVTYYPVFYYMCSFVPI